MKKLLIICLLSVLILTVSACSDDKSNDKTPTDATGTEPAAVTSPVEKTEEVTGPVTDAPTEAPTEPETEAPLCTVSFVDSVWVDVPPVTLHVGDVLTEADVRLPAGVLFSNGDAAVYAVPSGKTFTGDLSGCEKHGLGEYVVTGDVTLALDLGFETTKSVPLSDTSVINYYGRNYVTDEKVTFLNTSAGFEVRFYGTVLKATFNIRGAGPVGDDTQPLLTYLLRLRVYKDGCMDVGASGIVTVNRQDSGKQLVLAEFEDCGWHRVLIRKMNYDGWGYLEMTGLECDGGFTAAPAKPEKKILVYGDSITVGFGVEYRATGDYGGEVPEKEDGTRAYAALLADRYGAEIAEYCHTGVSIGVPNWRDTAIMQKEYWRQYAYYDVGSRYDMQQYVPDLVICNLGTNDFFGLENGMTNFGNGSPGVPNDFYTADDIEKAYADFISVMKQEYPDAAIIICYGMMGTGPSVNTAIRNAVRDCGFDDVYYLNFKMVELSANAGHPTLAGQQDAYEQLVKFIERNKIVFPHIDK